MKIGDYDIMPGATIGGAGAGALTGLAINEALNDDPTVGSRVGAGLLGALGGAALGTLGTIKSKNPAKKPEVENKRPLLKGLLAGVPISAGAVYAVDKYGFKPTLALENSKLRKKLEDEVGVDKTIRVRSSTTGKPIKKTVKYIPKNLRNSVRNKIITAAMLRRGKYAAMAALAGLPIGAYVTLKNV